jgi:hypothetical protein
MPCEHSTFAPARILTRIREVTHGGIDAEFGAGRQKCAALAYERGYALGEAQNIVPGGNEECLTTGRRAPREMLEQLPRCQAAEGRHACCICAYHEGFNAARARAIGRQVGDAVARDIADALPEIPEN